MSTYAIGDLQGCLASFDRLAAQLPDAERFVFVGDLVNRGPQSLATLRRMKSLAEAGRAAAVLGNHDLHLLAVAAGIRPVHRSDTIQEILDAPDRVSLLDRLRGVPRVLRCGWSNQGTSPGGAAALASLCFRFIVPSGASMRARVSALTTQRRRSWPRRSSLQRAGSLPYISRRKAS